MSENGFFSAILEHVVYGVYFAWLLLTDPTVRLNFFLEHGSWIFALLAVALLTWDLFIRRSPQISCGLAPDRTRKWRMGCLAVLAAVSAAGYFNYGRLHYENAPVFVHRWDMMHYYLGSKYFAENGYERMYLACVAADLEDGKIKPADCRTRKVRLMETYEIVPIQQVLDRLPEVKARFSPERWRSFKTDLNFFQSVMPLAWYQDSMFDHGYNPSPIWNAVGIVLTNHLPPAGPEMIHFFGLLDLLLMALLLVALTWAFGLKVMLFCLIVFSVNYPARWMWTGGSLLRLDWLAFLGLALCFLKQRWWLAAGACLAYSAGVRGFPVVVLFGPAVVAADWWWRARKKAKVGLEPQRTPRTRKEAASREQRVEREEKERNAEIQNSKFITQNSKLCSRPFASFAVHHSGVLAFFAGFAITGLLLAGFACYAAGSWQVWPQWLGKMQLHSKTALTNYMGLPFLMTYDEGKRAYLTSNGSLPDPFLPWKQAQNQTYQHIRPYYYAAALLALVLTALAVRGYPLHVAAAFSTVLIFVGFNLTCYYYSFLALLPLAALKKRLEWISIGLLALCAGQYMTVNRMNVNNMGWYDQQFAALSELTLFYLVIAAGVMLAGHGWIRRLWKKRR